MSLVYIDDLPITDVTQFRKWMGEPLNGVRHPTNIENVWSDADLNAIGLARVVRLQVPAGKIVENRRLIFENGMAVEYADVSDPPPPTPEEIDEEKEHHLDSMDIVGFRVDFDQAKRIIRLENIVRALADDIRSRHGQAALTNTQWNSFLSANDSNLTGAQFRTYAKGYLNDEDVS